MLRCRPVRRNGRKLPRAERVGLLVLFVLVAHTAPALAADDQLDPAFADGGIWIGERDRIRLMDVAVYQSGPHDGKIVAVGSVTNFAVASGMGVPDTDFLILRLNSDGTPDSSFGEDGVVTTDFRRSTLDTAFTVELQPDNKILVGGESWTMGTSGYRSLARYEPSGTLDPTFGDGDGWVLGPYTSLKVSDIALYPEGDDRAGQFVTVGSSHGGGCMRVSVIRYFADGTVDSEFERNPFGPPPSGYCPRDQGERVALVGNGRVLASGSHWTGDGDEFAAARFTDDGSLDASFGNAGAATAVPGGPEASASPWAMVVDDAGRAILAGSTRVNGAADREPALAAFDATGNLDAGFGNGGELLPEFGQPGLALGDLALDGSGRLIAAGSAGDLEGERSPALVRMLPNGVADDAFGDGGVARTPLPGHPASGVGAVAVVPGGLVVAGRVSYGSGRPLILRYGTSVDDVPPETSIVRPGHKRRGAQRHRRFRFESNDPRANFECRIDARAFTACASPYVAKNLRPGRHALRVRGRDSAGNADPTPAKRVFRIARRR